MAEENQEPKKIVLHLPGPLSLTISTMLFSTCLADHCVVDGIERRLSAINETLQEQQKPPELREENVLGGPEVESFYELGGERAYITIDGRPVSFYHPEEPSSQ